MNYREIKLLSLCVILSITGCSPLTREDRINEISPEFPLKGSTCLFDSSELRLEINNDSQYLYARAVIWSDNQEGDIKSISQERHVSDYSEILFELQNNNEITPFMDRNYYVNPLLKLTGLYFTVPNDKRGSNNGLIIDKDGEAYIRFTLDKENSIRVDTYKIPLNNLSVNIGETIGLGFYGVSISPEFQINSVGYIKRGQIYYAEDLPRDNFHEYYIK